MSVHKYQDTARTWLPYLSLKSGKKWIQVPYLSNGDKTPFPKLINECVLFHSCAGLFLGYGHFLESLVVDWQLLRSKKQCQNINYPFNVHGNVLKACTSPFVHNPKLGIVQFYIIYSTLEIHIWKTFAGWKTQVWDMLLFKFSPSPFVRRHRFISRAAEYSRV